MPLHDSVSDTARTYEPDRYLSALYAPEPARARLIALAGFQAEITRIPLTVREPLLVDIRLQWWRDALDAVRAGAATGHPVADALAKPVQSGVLPQGLLIGMIDAVGDQPSLSTWPDPQELRAHCAKLHGAAFALAARALGATHTGGLEAAVRPAGLAYGFARLLAQPNLVVASQRDAVAVRCLAAYTEAVAAVMRLDSALLPGFLPLAVVPAYMTVTPGKDVSALTRWWRLWRAQISGRLG